VDSGNGVTTYASRLARVEQALAPTAHEQAQAAWEARQGRYRVALEAILNTGMPRAYAEQGDAELVAGTPHEAWSALTRRANDLAHLVALVPESVNP
jgi:hypothetical protein